MAFLRVLKGEVAWQFSPQPWLHVAVMSEIVLKVLPHGGNFRVLNRSPPNGWDTPSSQNLNHDFFDDGSVGGPRIAEGE